MLMLLNRLLAEEITSLSVGFDTLFTAQTRRNANFTRRPKCIIWLLVRACYAVTELCVHTQANRSRQENR